jgi:hypothetical protein
MVKQSKIPCHKKGGGENFKNWVAVFVYYKLESKYKKSNNFEN